MFILTCKCPGCDKITSQCKDSTLSKDRTEYDSIRCKRCTHPTKPIAHTHGQGTGYGMYPSKKRSAISVRLSTPP